MKIGTTETICALENAEVRGLDASWEGGLEASEAVGACDG